MPAIQDNRFAKITSPLGDNVLLFHRMAGFESLNAPFEINLDLLSEKPHIAANDILGKALTVAVDLPNGNLRYFHGHVCRFGQGGMTNRLHSYVATLRPWLWFLSRSYNYRIFQQGDASNTTPKIVEAIFNEHGFSDYKIKLEKTYAEREYCVQYRETDLDFIGRLLEEEGIFYFFEHENGKHTMVIADSANALSPTDRYETIPFMALSGAGGGRKETISAWNQGHSVQTGTIVLRDFNFETPSTDLTVKLNGDKQYEHAKHESYDYPGRYADTAAGNTYAQCRREEYDAQHAQVSGDTNAMGLCTGALFSLADHPAENQNGQYMLLETRYSLDSDDYGSGGGSGGAHFQCTFTALHRDIPFRPPQKTPKPVMRGPQTAIVVGKQGEEIWTDKYGRVKVKFHWDRKDNKDEKSSCWLRVSQPWAGKGWGAIAIPRVGQEVIVDFLDGDPDRPIVTGRVYNAEQTVPYTLPDNATQTGIKSRSSKEGGMDNFNEFRMEDKKGEEEIYVHAEKDMNVVVENNATLKVGFDKKDAGDQTIDIYNNRTTTLDQGNDKLQIKTGNRDVVLDRGNHTLKLAKGNQSVQLDMGNCSVKIKMGNQDTKLDLGKSTTEAMQSIELKVGQSSIKVDQMGVTIKGMMIKIEGMTQTEVKGLMTQINGDAMLMMKGGITMVN